MQKGLQIRILQLINKLTTISASFSKQIHNPTPVLYIAPLHENPMWAHRDF